MSRKQRKAVREESRLPAALVFISNDPLGNIDRDGCIGLWPAIGIGAGAGAIGVGANMWCCRDRIRDALWEEREWAADETGIPHQDTPGSRTDALLHCSATCRMCANPGSCLWPGRALRILQRRESAGQRDNRIDMANNQAGCDLGRTLGSQDGCRDACLQALADGDLWSFDPAAPDDVIQLPEDDFPEYDEDGFPLF